MNFCYSKNMKNALILHGTDGLPEHNWFQWLQGKLEERDFKTWVPALPGANQPDPKVYNEFLLGSDWDFNSESILIGHSSGAVEILSLLQHLPEGIIIDKAILVGAFRDNLESDQLSNLFDEEFDFEKIKQRAKKIIFVHSDNDPYCPLQHVEYLSRELEAQLIIHPGEAHFSTSTAGEKYREFPLLLELIV